MADDLYTTTPTDDVLKSFFTTPGYKLLFGNQDQVDPLQRFKADPAYEFQMKEGTRAIQENAAAKGLLDSGVTLKNLEEYGQNLANQQFGAWQQNQNSLFSNYQNQLLGLSQIGMQYSGIPEQYQLGATNGQYAYNTGQSLAALGQNYANNLGGFYAAQGPQFTNLFMNTAAAKAQNYGNNYMMNMQMANNQQASQQGNQMGSSLFNSTRF